MDELKLKMGDYNIVIPLDALNTILIGDGNTGKSCLFKKLKEAVNNGEISGTFLFIDSTTMYNIEHIKTIKADLIVIDDFDYVKAMHPEIVTYLNKYKPRALIMGRDVFMLCSNKHYVFTVSVNEAKKTWDLEPLLPNNIPWL